MRKTDTPADSRFAVLGYQPYLNRHGRMSYIRTPQEGDFPRFHLYIENENARDYHCALHFDRVGPDYLKKKNAYRAVFDTPEIVVEATRLQNS